MTDIIFLEVDDLIAINKKVVKDYGGLLGIRDKGLLESATYNPQNLYFYQNADIYQIAASYAFSIIQNHPFLDGNKRTGFAAMAIFLGQNGIEINCEKISDTVEMMVKIATKKADLIKTATWLKKLKKL
jgi:death-on-curing protein